MQGGTALTDTSMEGVAVGDSGAIEWAHLAGASGMRGGALRLENRSGVGLRLSFPDSGNGAYLPARGIMDAWPLAPSDTRMEWTAIYVIAQLRGGALLASYVALEGAAGESQEAQG